MKKLFLQILSFLFLVVLNLSAQTIISGGNVSGTLGESESMWITPSGFALCDVTPESLLEIVEYGYEMKAIDAAVRPEIQKH